MLRVECPDCGEIVELSESIRVGRRVVCAECGVELEVLSLYPLEVDYVLEDDWEEDWEEDECSEEYDEEEDDDLDEE
jgi:lysine biosynthesis protein LysW